MFILRISHISLMLGSLVVYNGSTLAARTTGVPFSDDLRSTPCALRKPASVIELEDTLRGTARTKLHEVRDYMSYFVYNRAARLALGLLFPAAPFYCLELAALGIAYAAPTDPFSLKPEVDSHVEKTFQRPIIAKGIEVCDQARNICASASTGLWILAKIYVEPVGREAINFGSYLYKKWTSWG